MTKNEEETILSGDSIGDAADTHWNVVQAGWDAIEHGVRLIQLGAHRTAVSKGFHRGFKNFPVSIALMHSELSEALEAYRKHESDNRIAEELADTIIRVCDTAESFNLPLAKALVKKMKTNEKRPYKHGNKRI